MIRDPQVFFRFKPDNTNLTGVTYIYIYYNIILYYIILLYYSIVYYIILYYIITLYYIILYYIIIYQAIVDSVLSTNSMGNQANRTAAPAYCCETIPIYAE